MKTIKRKRIGVDIGDLSARTAPAGFGDPTSAILIIIIYKIFAR